jgi:hypothetical protein
MPLYSNAEKVIRENLEAVRLGNSVRTVAVGSLSDHQLQVLNAGRSRAGLPPVDGSVFFRGKHIYASRIVRDGYTVDDVLAQIAAAFRDSSIVRFNPKMSVLQSISPRDDGYGNTIRDEIALECTSRHPKAELYSVIPKGDRIKPADAPKKQEPPRGGSC